MLLIYSINVIGEESTNPYGKDYFTVRVFKYEEAFFGDGIEICKYKFKFKFIL